MERKQPLLTGGYKKWSFLERGYFENILVVSIFRHKSPNINTPLIFQLGIQIITLCKINWGGVTETTQKLATEERTCPTDEFPTPRLPIGTLLVAFLLRGINPPLGDCDEQITAFQLAFWTFGVATTAPATHCHQLFDVPRRGNMSELSRCATPSTAAGVPAPPWRG